jgi:hypothetical protein
VVGGVALIALVGLAYFLYRRTKRSREQHRQIPESEDVPAYSEAVQQQQYPMKDMSSTKDSTLGRTELGSTQRTELPTDTARHEMATNREASPFRGHELP